MFSLGGRISLGSRFSLGDRSSLGSRFILGNRFILSSSRFSLGNRTWSAEMALDVYGGNTTGVISYTPGPRADGV